VVLSWFVSASLIVLTIGTFCMSVLTNVVGRT
jgi:hypothetical protein